MNEGSLGYLEKLQGAAWRRHRLASGGEGVGGEVGCRGIEAGLSAKAGLAGTLAATGLRESCFLRPVCLSCDAAHPLSRRRPACFPGVPRLEAVTFVRDSCAPFETKRCCSALLGPAAL